MSKFKDQILLISPEIEQDIPLTPIKCVNITRNQLRKLKFQGNESSNKLTYIQQIGTIIQMKVP